MENKVTEYYTPAEVMKMLECTKYKMYAYLQDESFPSIKSGGRYLIPQKEFEQWRENQSLYFSTKEVMEILRCGRTKLRNYLSQDDFPKEQRGKHFVIPKKEFIEWQEKFLKDGKYL